MGVLAAGWRMLRRRTRSAAPRQEAVDAYNASSLGVEVCEGGGGNPPSPSVKLGQGRIVVAIHPIRDHFTAKPAEKPTAPLCVKSGSGDWLLPLELA